MQKFSHERHIKKKEKKLHFQKCERHFSTEQCNTRVITIFRNVNQNTEGKHSGEAHKI